MRKLKQSLIGLIVVAVVAVAGLVSANRTVGAAPPQQSSIVIADDDFAPGDWTMTVETMGSPTSATAQRAGGGNTGAYRATEDTFPAMGPLDFYSVTTFHWFEGAVYDPVTQGAIDHLDYQEDNILVGVTPAHNSPQVDGFFVIEQDGTIFTPRTHPTITSTAWQTYSSTSLQATDFYQFDSQIEGIHPDFSAQGGPITFGYARYRDRYENDPADVPVNQALVYEHGIDNWQVTVFQSATSPANNTPVAVDDDHVLDGLSDLDASYNFISVLENDSDPNNDPLTLVSSTDSQYGDTFIQGDDKVVWSWNGNHFSPDGDQFTYTISDEVLTDTATVTLYLDCGCSISCVFAALGAASPTNLQATATTTDTLNLALIYRLRDRVMKPTPHGSRYVEMYYETTPEIVRILMLTHTHLGDEAVAVVELWQDNLSNLVDGDGSAVITQTQVDAIKTFLANLSAAGSADLQQLIAAELARLGPLDEYVGLTVKEAKRQAIGDALIYLPLIIK